MSDEHLFSEWISKIVPKSEKSHLNYKISSTRIGSGTFISPSFKTFQGDLATRKFRVVCKKCNETWMSEIENSAKEVMMPLIQGQPKIITNEMQNCLSMWIVLKSIIGELDHPTHMAIPLDMRRWFYENKRPPSGWKIWIGVYHGKEWKKRYRHVAGRIVRTGELPIDRVIDANICNSQASTFVIGNLFMHSIYSSVPEIHKRNFGSLDIFLYQVFPNEVDQIHCTSDFLIMDDAASQIADRLVTSL